MNTASSIRVRVSLTDPVLSRAVEAVLGDNGAELEAGSGADSLSIGDVQPADVLVIEATPVAAKAALDGVLRGAVRSVVTPASLRELGPCLAGIARGVVTIPCEVVAAAERVSHLGGRQLDVLEAVTAGWDNQEISAKLHLSIPTVKRDIAKLQRALNVRTRSSLVVAGHQLGCGRRDPSPS
jgi:DNA-binding NarL/FixJ family response regulator